MIGIIIFVCMYVSVISLIVNLVDLGSFWERKAITSETWHKIMLLAAIWPITIFYFLWIGYRRLKK